PRPSGPAAPRRRRRHPAAPSRSIARRATSTSSVRSRRPSPSGASPATRSASAPAARTATAASRSRVRRPASARAAAAGRRAPPRSTAPARPATSSSASNDRLERQTPMKTRPWLATLGVAVTIALAARLAADSQATDVGVTASRLVVGADTVRNKFTIDSTRKHGDVHLGAIAGPGDLSGELEVYYVDAPANRGVLPIPAPWAKTTPSSAEFVNTLAPLGPSAVKLALVKPGKMVKVSARALGGLDISQPPGAGGVVIAFTVHNAVDASTHRMCSLYAAAQGSTIKHRRTATGHRLTLSRGVPTACPSCSDGFQNETETDVDCGGPACSACEAGDHCAVASDCTSGVCTAGTCQAPTCSDGVENGNETDVDCGATCPDCADGRHCAVADDCV